MKKVIPIFSANIIDDNGTVKIPGAEKDRMDMWTRSFNVGSVVDITIKKHTDQRTSLQNGYYFGVVLVILADFFGYEAEEMHDEMKLKFNPVESKFKPGVMVGGSTAKMSAEEFFGNETSYINRIRRWAASEYGVNIPDPKKAE